MDTFTHFLCAQVGVVMMNLHVAVVVRVVSQVLDMREELDLSYLDRLAGHLNLDANLQEVLQQQFQMHTLNCPLIYQVRIHSNIL